MKLTGKCKEDFEKWISKQKYSITHDVGERQMNIVPLGSMFEQLPQSMQYGVYVDFFDSVWVRIIIDIDLEHIKESEDYMLYIEYEQNNFGHCGRFQTRQEARISAIKEANEIHNCKL